MLVDDNLLPLLISNKPYVIRSNPRGAKEEQQMSHQLHSSQRSSHPCWCLLYQKKKKKTKTLRVTLLKILPKKSSADCKLWGLDFHHKALFKIMLNQKFTLWGRISEQGPVLSSLNGFPVDLPNLNCPRNLGCWAPGSDAPRPMEGWGLELLQLLKVQEMKSEAKSTSN